MTKPLEKYPKETFSMIAQLREMKRNGISFKELPPEKAPFDVKETKKKFVKEVLQFKPNYGLVMGLNRHCALN